MIVLLLAFAALAPPPNVQTDNPLLDRGFRDLYDLKFDDAHQSFHEFEKAHPGNPLGPVSDAAAYLFLEFDRLKILRSDFFVENTKFLGGSTVKANPTAKQDFEADLQQSKRLSDALLRRAPDDEWALFATVMRIALHADYEGLIEKQYWQSLREIKEARTDADELLVKYPDCYDAYLAVGVENYLLSQKRAPVRWFLKLAGAETDKQAGIAALRVVADKGHYFRAYAKVLLAIAALRDDNKAEAKRIVSELAQEFPNNDLFRDELKKLS